MFWYLYIPVYVGYPIHGEGKDGYPPPGYPSQGYPEAQGYPPQSYPPPQHYAQPPPVQQTGDGASQAASKGCLEGWYLSLSLSLCARFSLLFDLFDMELSLVDSVCL